jgi:L-amino acid N-acyltransferase YncA
MSELQFAVEQARSSDYEVCLPLLKLLYHGDIGPNFKNVFQEYSEDGEVLLAKTSDRVLGILLGGYNVDADWEGRIARIDAIIVHDQYRTIGVGGKLVKSFIDIAQKHECRAIKSRINVTNLVSQKFHEDLEFLRMDTYEYVLELSINNR